MNRLQVVGFKSIHSPNKQKPLQNAAAFVLHLDVTKKQSVYKMFCCNFRYNAKHIYE